MGATLDRLNASTPIDPKAASGLYQVQTSDHFLYEPEVSVDIDV
jgi:hypothetical protein